MMIEQAFTANAKAESDLIFSIYKRANPPETWGSLFIYNKCLSLLLHDYVFSQLEVNILQNHNTKV